MGTDFTLSLNEIMLKFLANAFDVDISTIEIKNIKEQNLKYIDYFEADVKIIAEINKYQNSEGRWAHVKIPFPEPTWNDDQIEDWIQIKGKAYRDAIDEGLPKMEFGTVP